MAKDKKEIDEAREALDVNVDASTRTIQARFRRKAKELNSGQAETPRSKKSFEELNEAYQLLMKDRHRQQSAGTKHVAVLSSDVAEFSRMMATNEAETLEFFNLCKDVFEEIVEHHNGRVFNTAGDAILAEFPYVFNAVDCAVEIQKELRAINLGQPDGKKVLFRMGINIGDVYEQGTDLLGDTVNIAARLQTVAKPGGICISKAVHDLIANKTVHTVTFLGEKIYKNIPQPVRTYILTEDDGTARKHAADPKIEAFKGEPRTGKIKAPAKSESTGISVGRILSVVGVAALAGGAWFVWSTQQAAPPAPKKAAAPVAAMGSIYISVQPDATVTLSSGGKEAFKGTIVGGMPLKAPMTAGTYSVRVENKEAGIDAGDVLTVDAGKEARFERKYDAKKAADAGAGGTAGGTFAGGSASVPLTPDEEKLKTNAAQGDSESGYRLGKSRLEKGDFDSAYHDFLEAAQKQHALAQLELGKLFLSGKGSPWKDPDAAVYWLLKAALNGRSEATQFLNEHRTELPEEFGSFITAQMNIDTKPDRKNLLLPSQKKFVEETLQGSLQNKGIPY